MQNTPKVKFYFKIIKEALDAFIDNKGLKLSASLAYYTIFALAPMLVVVLSVGGIFYGHEALQGKLFNQLNDFLGNDTAFQIQDTVKNLALSGKSNLALITGVITLIIGASGVFVEIQDSINQIWGVKSMPKKGWLKLLINRLVSLSMVASLGFLLIVSLMINSLILAFNSEISRFLPDFMMGFFNAINFIITFSVLTSLFAIIYKVLPDAEIEWKSVRAGSVFTAILFLLGKYLIGFYITYAAIGSIYGAAGTIIIIAVWVYYSAAILFFGAEFTWAFAKVKGLVIKPSKFAVSIKMIEVEQGKKPVDLK